MGREDPAAKPYRRPRRHPTTRSWCGWSAHYYFDDGGAGMAANRKAYVQAAMAAVFDYGLKLDRVAQA